MRLQIVVRRSRLAPKRRAIATGCLLSPGRPPSVAAGDAPPSELSGERVEVVRWKVDGWDPERSPGDWFVEVDPDAAVRAPAERDVTVSQAPPDPDCGDPGPGSLDSPGGKVRHRGPELVPAEANREVAVEIDPGVVAPDAEEHEDGPRAAADTDRRTDRRHSWKGRRDGKRVGETDCGAAACQYPAEVLTPGC